MPLDERDGESMQFKNLSPAISDAWAKYQQGLDEVRQLYYNHPFAAYPPDRQLADYHVLQIQAAAFNLVIAPRPDYPRFTLHGMFDPISYTWLGPNPDTPYRGAFVDGGRTYRIWGKRKNSRICLMQSLNCYFTLPPAQMRQNGSYDFEHFHIEADGSFEIIVSATPHEGNWIKTDPAQERNFILVRDYIVDWEIDEMVELHIEAVDDVPPRPVDHGEDELMHRLEEAVRFMKFCVGFYQYKVTEDALRDAGGKVNSFAIQQSSSAPSGAGGNASVTFCLAVFDIEPDEALIIEYVPPDCKYWQVNLCDRWSSQVSDYLYHQSSLNLSQAVLDSDGKFRAVLSVRDPGVANWLDPVGNLKGYVVNRWIPLHTTIPEARKIKLCELFDHLPADTPRVTPKERAAALRKRARAGLRRYGY